MNTHLSQPLLLIGLFCGATLATGHELPAVVVTGHYDNSVGSSDAASQGVIGSDLLRNRAMLRPAEVLEYVPGMVVTQHSSDGKANQYFLRGMNLDHGTDFATTINGVPVNMPTHAHGQGYSDLNFLMPELVSRVEYRKGPYFASEGDFSSAGSAHIVYRNKLDRPFSSLSIGQRGYLRGFAAGSRQVSEGVTLLTAVERMNNNGPWSVPEGIRKLNTLFTLSGGSTGRAWATSFSAYSARWNATDQVPQRLVDVGSFQGQPFGRFDSLDPSDGGKTQRLSLSGYWRQAGADQVSSLQWYAIQYDLRLFSNFTYALERASDQFGQTDNRTVFGGKAYRSWFSDLGADRPMENTLGIQLRQDRIRVGLYDTATRQIQTTVRQDGIRQTQIGLYAENEIKWKPWLKTVAGVRADQLQASVTSEPRTENSGSASAFKVSPKLSVILGPWNKTEFFVNAGKGFHSNDARGMTARTDPRTGLPVARVQGLVASQGEEFGIKTEIVPRLQSTLAIWRLNFDSELAYVGDQGNTEAGRPSRRSGVEWSNHWTPGEHVLIDANLAWTRPRYADGNPAERYIANAVQKVANLSLALRNLGPWSGSLGVRHIGSAPLTEDNRVRSTASITSNLRIQRQISSTSTVALDVLNLTQRKNNDISYFYTSRLPGEPASGVADIHSHPAEPRTLRLTARMQF